MVEFKVTKDIRANGRRWDMLIDDLFENRSVRDAWIDLENEFDKNNVENLVNEISKYYGDCGETVEYTVLENGSVVARYFPKNISRITMEAYGFPDGIEVIYEMSGCLEVQETYAF